MRGAVRWAAPVLLALALPWQALAGTGKSRAVVSDEDLLRRFREHRVEFEELRGIALANATRQGQLGAVGRRGGWNALKRGSDSLSFAWAQDPRVKRLQRLLDLDAVIVWGDSTITCVARSPRQRALAKRNESPEQLLDDEKGYEWSAHELVNFQPLLDGLPPPRSGRIRHHRPITGGWTLFRELAAVEIK